MATHETSPETASGGSGIHERNRQWGREYQRLASEAEQAEQSGDTVAARRLKTRMSRVEDEFLRANEGLIYPVLRRFDTTKARKLGVMGDYRQEGRLGLLEAFRLWDPEHRATRRSTGEDTLVTFGTFSRRYISGRIRRAVHFHEGNGGTYHDWSDAPKIRAIIEELQESGIQSPSNEEVAWAAEDRYDKRVTVGQVERIRRPRDTSLNRRVGESGDTELGDLIAEQMVDDSTPSVDLTASPALELLAKVEATALFARMAEDDLTAEDVLAMTPDALRQLLAEHDSRAIGELAQAAGRTSNVSSETLDHMAERLDPQALFVVMRRDGLDGADPMTNAQLADLTGVGREALRRKYLASLSRLLEIPVDETADTEAVQTTAPAPGSRPQVITVQPTKSEQDLAQPSLFE